MKAVIVSFPESRAQAHGLATELGLPCQAVELRRFPDGESLVRVPSPAPNLAIVYRSLDDPNAKLVELILAASALRSNGTKQVILVAPYLAYMRQDMAFHPGEAVSQRIVGQLIAQHFDGLVTIDPHLHRISRLDEAVPGIPALSLSSAPLLATFIDCRKSPLLIGPDSESRPWVEAIAKPLGLDMILGEKQRNGDRAVELVLPGIDRAAGRRVVLVDDIISSGATMIAATRQLLAAGAISVEALVTHCLASDADLACLREAGIMPIRSTDSINGPAAILPVASLLADAVRDQGWA